MSYESIFDKVNNISIHGNMPLDLRKLCPIHISDRSEIPYIARHYPEGTIFTCNCDVYMVGHYQDAILLTKYENRLSDTSDDANDEEQPCHEIKKTTCDACGAHLPINNVNNNGVCKCEYCDTFHYVW